MVGNGDFEMIVSITVGLVVGIIGLAISYIVYFVTAAICKRIDSRTITDGMHKFRIVPLFGRTKVYMDGKELMGVRSIDYHISYDEIPTVKIELAGNMTEFNGILEIRNVPDRK